MEAGEKRGQIRARRVNQFEIIPIRREKSDLSRQTCAASDPRIDGEIEEESRMERMEWEVGREEERRRKEE